MPYTPTVWVNNSAPALNAANLNKIENELESQAVAVGVPYTKTVWSTSGPPLTHSSALNNIESGVRAVALALGLGYSPTIWDIGWTPPRNASNFNKIENQLQANRAEIESGSLTATHIGDFNDGVEVNGGPVKDDSDGGQWGSQYKIVNPVPRNEPLYRLSDGVTIPALVGRQYVAEFLVPEGGTHDDGSARNEVGISNTTQTELMPQYGEIWWHGWAVYLDPQTFLYEGASGQTTVLNQWKGTPAAPYITISNADQDRFHLRRNYLSSLNLCTLGGSETWVQLAGHWLRFVMRVYWHENDGEVEFWYKKGAGALVKQTLTGGVDKWIGTTMQSGDTGTRWRLGQYTDSPPWAESNHKLWSGGMVSYRGDDPGAYNLVVPPEPA